MYMYSHNNIICTCPCMWYHVRILFLCIQDPSAIIGRGCRIGPSVVIGPDVIIEDGTYIYIDVYP